MQVFCKNTNVCVYIYNLYLKIWTWVLVKVAAGYSGHTHLG